MKDREAIREQLLPFLEGSLSTEEAARVRKALAEDEVLFREFDQLRTVLEAMTDSPDLPAPAHTAEQFFGMLQQEKQREQDQRLLGQNGKVLTVIREIWNKHAVVRIAASVALFVAGFLIDKQVQVADIQTQEMQVMREELNATRKLVILSMLRQESASDRIQGAQFSYQSQQLDPTIREALVDVLENDPNSNVRLAVAEALAYFAADPTIAEALATTLPNQEDPSVQILIIETLVSRQQESALGSIQQLLEKPLNEVVRLKAEEGLGKLM